MSTRLKVLFVDDEPSIVQGLKRMLYRMRGEWDMRFFTEGQEALESIRQEPCDVIVADMRMPRMTGGQLLKAVRELHPETIRLILSGFSDEEHSIQTVGSAHQFLIKPCDSNTLRNAILRATTVRELSQKKEILHLVAGIDHLPSLPSLYSAISAELGSSDPKLDRVIRSIQADPPLTLKVLQLVNSGFFGLPRVISDIEEAIRLLGVEILQAIVLFSGIHGQASQKGPLCVPYEEFSAHSLEVATLAKRIGQQLGFDRHTQNEAFTAGVLHDVGKLIFSLYQRDLYAQVLAEAENVPGSLPTLERNTFGVTHGELGSALATLWGLPCSLSEAIAFHNNPGISGTQCLDALVAVHLANGFLRFPACEHGAYPEGQFDGTYLDEVGLSDRLPELHQLYASMSPK